MRPGAARWRPPADLVFYGTLDGYLKARNSDTGELLWKFKMPSGAIGYPMTYTHKGTQYVAIYYGVGGWPAVGLVFDLNDPTAGLGAVGAFKNLANWTQMGGGMLVFSLDGKGPYDDVNLDEYPPEMPKSLTTRRCSRRAAARIAAWRGDASSDRSVHSSNGSELIHANRIAVQGRPRIERASAEAYLEHRLIENARGTP